MKKVVNRMVYDTEKATKIVDNYGPGNPQDFSYYEEALYRTKAGRWFLAGEGNARSKYAVSISNTGTGPGQDITPLTEEEVIQWCETYNKTEVLERWFKRWLEDA